VKRWRVDSIQYTIADIVRTYIAVQSTCSILAYLTDTNDTDQASSLQLSKFDSCQALSGIVRHCQALSGNSQPGQIHVM